MNNNVSISAASELICDLDDNKIRQHISKEYKILNLLNINKTIFNLCSEAERGQRGKKHKKINTIITDMSRIYIYIYILWMYMSI